MDVNLQLTAFLCLFAARSLHFSFVSSQIHVVHFNSDKYSDMSMAVDKSDGLAVLGVLIEVRHCRRR